MVQLSKRVKCSHAFVRVEHRCPWNGYGMTHLGRESNKMNDGPLNRPGRRKVLKGILDDHQEKPMLVHWKFRVIKNGLKLQQPSTVSHGSLWIDKQRALRTLEMVI